MRHVLAPFEHGMKRSLSRSKEEPEMLKNQPETRLNQFVNEKEINLSGN